MEGHWELQWRVAAGTLSHVQVSYTKKLSKPFEDEPEKLAFLANFKLPF